MLDYHHQNYHHNHPHHHSAHHYHHPNHTCSSLSSYLFILTYSMTLILPPTQSLYPVLELLVDDADAVLQQAARTTLDRIAIYLGYSTTANLLKYALRTYLALTCTAYSFTDRYASDRYFSVRYTSDRYSTSLTVTSLTVTPLTVTSLSVTGLTWTSSWTRSAAGCAPRVDC